MLGNLFRWAVLRPILKPLTRILVGLIAIPVFRLVIHKGMRVAKVEAELEKDLEEWFRASLILLVATANMEHLLFGWVPLDLEGDQSWVGVFFRLLLVIGVIELMPDQALFSVLHSGPLNLPVGKRLFHDLWRDRVDWIKKFSCVHLNRSSPVLAMMSAIFGGDPDSPGAFIGWVCYLLAITQYIIIALITSSEKAGDLLAQFDQAVAEQREELISEFAEDDDEEAPNEVETPSQ
ncbi:MAG: DNA topoisomerase I [Akkermansiaceae bacterium]